MANFANLTSKKNSLITSQCKPTLEFVVSAPLYGLFPNLTLAQLRAPDPENPDIKFPQGNPALIKEILENLSSITWRNIQAKCKHYNPLVGVLYNAFTEQNQQKNFNYYGKLKFENVYVDSGGLQIVTAERKVTDEIKDYVYRVQADGLSTDEDGNPILDEDKKQLQGFPADYAMCFDEIALVTKNLKVQKLDAQGKRIRLDTTGKRMTGAQIRQERSNYNNKWFDVAQAEQCGIHTGQNVKRQIDHFREVGAKTKVVLIIQGNTLDDMLKFYDNVIGELEDDDFGHIGGFAVADTCIGNGVLESIKILDIAKRIADEAPSCIGNHLHLLGVGSIARVAPVIYLTQSGFFNKIKHISFDSSSLSQAFCFGNLKLEGKTKKLGDKYNPATITHCNKVYDYYKEYFEKYITKEALVEILLGDYKNAQFARTHKETFKGWSSAKIRDRVHGGDRFEVALANVYKTVHMFYQIDDFMVSLNNIFEGWTPDSKLWKALATLREKVHNDESMEGWLKEIAGSPQMSNSKPIKRLEANRSDVTRFFKQCVE